MQEDYVQGFIQKCAEAGVDPDELAKLAQDYGNNQPSRLGAYVAGNPLLNIPLGTAPSILYGAARPGPDNRIGGALKGLLSSVGGTLAGGGIGGLAGAAFGKPGIGGALGASLGGGEALYRALGGTPDKPQEPQGKLEKIKAAIMELMEKIRG